MSKISNPREAVQALADELEAHGARNCSLALVLGSGLGALAEALDDSVVLQARQLKHLPACSVEGHAGRIVLGELHGVRILIQQGRVHLYEGRSIEQVTRAVRAFARVGIGALVLTNAAGCLQPDWAPGGFMRITDHLNLQGAASLRGAEACRGSVYDPRFGAEAQLVARELGMELKAGIYAGLLGPSYETPAEIRMLQFLGAQAVGMSTVAEAAAARVAGMRVLGLSCMTNYAAGIEAMPLRHADVIRAGSMASDGFVDLCKLLLPRLATLIAEKA